MKRGNLKKRIVLVLSIALVFGLLVVPYTFADDKDDLKKINAERDALSKQYSNTKARSNALASQIKSLEREIYSSEVEITNLELGINETKERIKEALVELEIKKQEVGEQSKDLNQRLRAMYKSGEVGILSVLLGSKNMSDFMTNMDVVERIYDADAKLLKELQVQYSQVDEKKNELLGLKESLEAQESTVSAKKSALADTKANVKIKKAVVDADVAVLSEQIDALNQEANSLIAKILQLQGTGAYVGGSMCWPAESSTKITSPFGMRMHPILKENKMHTGIDIGAAGGTNILAANSGIVISAGWNNSYGYMIMIDHGGGIVTLYAHSQKLLVQKDDVVNRGQAIALVGSTGMSTGNHLHFEVRVNGEYKDPMGYVSTSIRK